MMPAVHDTRKKAEETLMGYVHNLNKFSKNYLSLFDFIIEGKCPEPNELAPDFESAKEVIGSTEFIFASESFCLLGVELNRRHIEALKALNQLFTIAEAWNKEDGFVPDFSDFRQEKWFPWFTYNRDAERFVFSSTAYTPASAFANIGARLCFKTSERAKQFGKQFESLYNKVFS